MTDETKEKSIFDEFTGKYSLSKTLRFELNPIGKTLDNMREHLRYDENLQTFLADQEIENAYQSLKPVFDFLHEQFINESLESDIVKKINFAKYLEKYKHRKDLQEKDFESVEKSLRDEFPKAYDEAAEKLKIKAGKNKKGKDILTDNGYKILTEKGILEYIEKNTAEFSRIKPKEEIEEALTAFEGFFTYFGGFNQNRENYYETKKEAATAVATRIVHENLPKFCDNILFFDGHSENYKNAYGILQKLGRSLVNKEGEQLTSIKEAIFKIEHFNFSLSQKQIEEYNNQVGNANSVINLYNQAKREEKGFTKLPILKTLYKQIGCGKRKSLFFALSYDREQEYKKKEGDNEIKSVEEVLNLASEAGKKYFKEKNDDDIINTVPEFLEYLKNRENYLGVYWSKAAINTISGKYFANWHALKDRLKEEKIFKKADKNSEEEIKTPEAVELEGLFEVLDGTENWKDVLFKSSILDDASKKKIIVESKNASVALLSLIFADIEKHATAFLNQAHEVLSLKEYKDKTGKEAIKSWMDHALTINQILKYFLVKESKVKGNAIDSTISQALDVFVCSEDADWFKWYEALRNYLTKKPQDDAKENKLKLNFENGSLLGGWSDGQEKNKAAVLLKNEDSYYLGILRKKSLFDTTKEKNPIYQKANPKTGRLILANLKFKTLAGKGFLGKFGKAYSDMGKENPIKAMESLKEIIKERYLKKYPLLNEIIEKSYTDKKNFDKDLQRVLTDSYRCEFTPIDWKVVQEYTDLGDMYLFQIYTKDFSGKSTGNKDMQTLYWSTVFAVNSSFQLNGGGEIFYRKQAIKDRDKKIKKGYENKKFIVDNRRFTTDKFLFHCPVVLNYKSVSGMRNGKSNPQAIKIIKDLINSNLSSNESLHFLGIDRGEKHLAYYSLVDKNGVIEDQGTLNIPFLDKNENPRTVKAEKRTLDKDGKEQIEIVECKDYNELLGARAGDRDYARKNWQTIGTIKDLKDGYISQVIRKIADLAVTNNAFIVLEYLDTGFKRGRQKIEKSVYQKLELALAKKLNFLVDKMAEPGQVGSVTNALQLTPPVANYGDIEKRKQVGIMLYTRANYTSQTDPITGWRKSIYLKKGSEEYIKSQITGNFSDIGFDEKDYFFLYEDGNTHKLWTLYSGKNGKSLDRYHREKGGNENDWNPTRKDIVEMLNGIFGNFDKRRSIHSQIVDEGTELKKIDSVHTAWESLRFTIELIQQIRNTGTIKEDDDFIFSPVRDKNGNHFDSRKAADNQPNSGDANGAYNIAIKGIIMNEHIKRGYKLYIADAEWDAWLAGKEIWEKWISDNEKSLKKGAA